MSHQPPIPEASQSPYPIQEPPHTRTPEAEEASPAGGRSLRDRAAGLVDELPTLSTRAIVGVGAAISLGVAATVGALLFARGGRRSPGRRKSRRTT